MTLGFCGEPDGRTILASYLALIAALVAVPAAPACGASTNAVDQEWHTIGLMRVRDMTPFGISRLDMLPAHAVASTPGTLAFEMTYSYQNTWALSPNVEDYLEERGVERGEIGAAEIAEIMALPDDAYLVDGELGLVDFTLQYRAFERLSFYGTVPYLTPGSGFLDSTVEGFHDGIGFSSAGRNFVPRDRFLVLADLAHGSIALDRPPPDELGDPVLGTRYRMRSGRAHWNLVMEGALKLGIDGGDSVLSNDANDYGVQLSLQRFFPRNALYLSLAGVDYHAPDRAVSQDGWIPTVVGGWERRISRRSNLVLQASVSDSTIRNTAIDELSATKIPATGGLQWLLRGYVLRFGITENLANCNNTPDIGANLSIARVFLGSR